MIVDEPASGILLMFGRWKPRRCQEAHSSKPVAWSGFRVELVQIPISFLVLATALQSVAFAEPDRANNDDTSEYLEQIAVEDEEWQQEELSTRPSSNWSGKLGISALGASNAGQSNDDRLSTVYVWPSASMVFKSTPKRNWQVSGNLTIDGDYYLERGNELNEARASWSLSVERVLNVGKVTFGVRGRSTFSGSFFDHDYNRAGPFISIRTNLGKAIGLSASAEQRFSDVPNARRLVTTVRGRLPIAAKSDAGKFGLVQEFRFSAFQAGGNSGRRDLRSSTTLQFAPKLALVDRLRLGINATLFKNFSNRTDRRFVDFELGPTITYGF